MLPMPSHKGPMYVRDHSENITGEGRGWGATILKIFAKNGKLSLSIHLDIKSKKCNSFILGGRK